MHTPSKVLMISVFGGVLAAKKGGLTPEFNLKQFFAQGV